MRIVTCLLVVLVGALIATPSLHADDGTAEERIERLEKEVGLLRKQLAELRSELAALRTAGNAKETAQAEAQADDMLVGNWRLDMAATAALMKKAGVSENDLEEMAREGPLMNIVLEIHEKGTFYVSVARESDLKETAKGTWKLDGKSVTLYSTEEDGRVRETPTVITGTLTNGQLHLLENKNSREVMVFVPTSESALRLTEAQIKALKEAREAEAAENEVDPHGEDRHEDRHDAEPEPDAPAKPVEESDSKAKASSIAGAWTVDREATRTAMMDAFAEMLDGLEGPAREMVEQQIKDGIDKMELSVTFNKDGTWTGLMKNPTVGESSPASGTWTQKGAVVTIVTLMEDGKQRETPESMQASLEGKKLVARPGGPGTPPGVQIFLVRK